MDQNLELGLCFLLTSAFSPTLTGSTNPMTTIANPTTVTTKSITTTVNGNAASNIATSMVVTNETSKF